MTRIVTLNAGLLRKLSGLIEPAPHVAERSRALPALLAELDADVIALQEVYDRRDQEVVARGLGATLPFRYLASSSTWRRLADGLVTLAKVSGAMRYVAFRDATWEERMLARKGMLIIEFSTPRPWRLINVHTTAGGLHRHPESAQCDRIRDRQILQVIGEAGSSASPTLVVGDFNAGPGVSQANYERFVASGWCDLFARGNPTAHAVTWDPDNPLNRHGAHARCPPQRIDHAFARVADLVAGRVVLCGSKIVLDRPRVAIEDDLVTVSDHNALMIDIEL